MVCVLWDPEKGCDTKDEKQHHTEIYSQPYGHLLPLTPGSCLSAGGCPGSCLGTGDTGGRGGECGPGTADTAAVPSDDEGRDRDIYIRTFGFFEVFICGEALLIHNAKAKELLALLVDRRGAYVSQGDIISCLWESESVNKVTLARLRKAAMLLRNVLKEHQLEDLVESRKGFRRLNTKMVNCDLYDYLSQKPEYQHLYRGTYMANYSWGELTIDELDRVRHNE